MGFLIQSNAKTPSYLNTRYQQFYLQALEKLKKLPIDEFNQYKQSIITEMNQPPQTFYEEVGRYLSDFSRNIFSFDTREKVIATLGTATKEQVIEYYENAVIKHKGLAVSSQVIGQGVDIKEVCSSKRLGALLDSFSVAKILPIKEDAE